MSKALPTVIIPYTGYEESDQPRDIFVYLRPETNGVLVESTLLRVVEGSQRYRDAVTLQYLANIPGEFMVSEGIIEDHYRYKMPFAVYGGLVFTDYMKSRFERYYGEDFHEEKVIGAFAALKELGLSEEELFSLRVPGDQVLNIHCQTVKKINNLFVVNYDIPALIHKNSQKTDIAVMLFRSTQSNKEFHDMIDEMEESVRVAGIVKESLDIGRAFHFTKGPFDQILDARGHLFRPDGSRVPLQDMQFCSFLRGKGILCGEVDRTLDHPIMEFRDNNGDIREECLYTISRDVSYQQAFELLSSSVSQYLART